MKTKKIKEEPYDLPNKMHLDACQRASRVYRNRKKNAHEKLNFASLLQRN